MACREESGKVFQKGLDNNCNANDRAGKRSDVRKRYRSRGRRGKEAMRKEGRLDLERGMDGHAHK